MQQYAAERLRFWLRNDPSYHAAMQTGDHNAYRMAVAKAFSNLQREVGGGMAASEFNPNVIWKMATGTDLNSAMHASDFSQLGAGGLTPSGLDTTPDQFQSGNLQQFGENPTTGLLNYAGYAPSVPFGDALGAGDIGQGAWASLSAIPDAMGAVARRIQGSDPMQAMWSSMTTPPPPADWSMNQGIQGTPPFNPGWGEGGLLHRNPAPKSQSKAGNFDGWTNKNR